jgi:hypothetical protein
MIVLSIFKRAHPGTDIFHVATSWITAYFCLTMTTNVLLSGKYFLVSHRYIASAHTRPGAIALRILLTGSPLGGSRPHWLIIFTLIESSALYTFTVVAALATFLSGSFGQYVAVDSIVPMVVSVLYILFLPFYYY